MRSNANRWATVLLLSVAALGCDKLKEKAAERELEKATGGEVDIDRDKGQVDLKTKDPDGKQTHVQLGKSATLPPDFPKSVPIYPGAQVIATINMGEGKRGAMVTLTSADKPETVIGYYKKSLASYKVDNEVNLGGVTMISATDATGMQLTVTITKADDGTTNLQLITTPKA